MRILWHSDPPWYRTGYGRQTALFVPLIRDLLGHELALSSWSVAGGKLEYLEMPFYPRGADRYSNDVLWRHARHFGAELVITLTDTWVYRAESMRKMPWVPWRNVYPRTLTAALRR